MLTIYCCLSTVSWEGHQRFHKGVVKPTFPFRIYQQPCNSGGLKYGQSACYSTSPGCFCSSHCTQMVLPPPCQSNIVRPADASGMRRDLVMPFTTLSAKDVCQESENQSVDLPDLKKNTTVFYWKYGKCGRCGGIPQSNLNLQVVSRAFFLTGVWRAAFHDSA